VFPASLYKNPGQLICLLGKLTWAKNEQIHSQFIYIAKCTVTCRPVSRIGHSPQKLPTKM